MPIDFSKIKAKKKEAGSVDPIELFQKLKVNDPNVNDLWLAQGDALREWNDNRNKLDVGVALNTGAGKTLVGLLIAQSLVNETKGCVLYVCSSIQLVEQTTEKAKGYGLNVTTYYHGKYSNDLFRRGKAPCITTYQALFNGKSVFFREEIEAIVFDDSHTAEHLLRDSFSLRLERNTFPEAFTEIVSLFREYHRKVGKAGSYSELDEESCPHIFLVPPFELQQQYSKLLSILKRAKLTDKTSTVFAWEYLRDRIDLCCTLITGHEITITPPFLPVKTLPYFSDRKRRIYLSATLSSSDAFARTFGCIPNKIIAPITSAGDCERLIIMPSKLGLALEDTAIARELIDRKKALILVPTYARAIKWQGMAEPPERDKVSHHVTLFKNSPETSKLLMAARYDGVDLPGDTCRFMVIDDLPMGVGPLEKFLWEYLKLSNSLRTTIASRIVQSFGRISRGMSDHGVFILTGERLIDWLLTPRNISTLPTFLQKQISLGLEVSNQAESVVDLAELIEQFLDRDEKWFDTYDDFIKNEQAKEVREDTEKLTEIAQIEADFIFHFWQRDYEKAAMLFSTNLEKAFDISNSTGGWHAMWLGRALELFGDQEAAKELYSRAHASQKNIPAHPSDADKDTAKKQPVQVVEVDRQFQITANGKILIPNRLHQNLAHMDGSGSPAQTEECLRALGQYLGLKATRPDKEFGTGPDVIWEIENNYALCIELKTDKKEDSKYSKKEIGQLNDHVQWAKDKTDIVNIIPIFIGPLTGATDVANPPEDFKVAKLKEFKYLSDRLVEALQDVADNSLHINLSSQVARIFKERKLMWPECLETIEIKNLREL